VVAPEVLEEVLEEVQPGARPEAPAVFLAGALPVRQRPRECPAVHRPAPD
jgi:hypothetical protein